MGHHFVPQRYLKGFQTPEMPEWIWMFHKGRQNSKHLPIKNVAQASGYYEIEIETSLGRDVEVPGNNVIDKILRGERVSGDPLNPDRQHLSYYIATMIRRVPHARANAQKFVPQTIVEVVAEIKQKFVEAEKAGLIDSTRLAERLVEADAWEKKALLEPPDIVRKTIETPWPFESMLHAIHNMHWRVLRAQGPSFFLTSDNPAYFFEGFGLGHQEAELVLPLSTHLLLHCSWQPVKNHEVQPIPDRLVRELNRRVATGAEDCVFYHEDADWVLKTAMTQHEELNRIRWT